MDSGIPLINSNNGHPIYNGVEVKELMFVGNNDIELHLNAVFLDLETSKVLNVKCGNYELEVKLTKHNG